MTAGFSRNEVFPGIRPDGFAGGVGPVPGDANQAHPFCEGNGRAQHRYLKQLAARAGHAIDLSRDDRDASRWSSAGDHTAIARCIRLSLV